MTIHWIVQWALVLLLGIGTTLTLSSFLLSDKPEATNAYLEEPGMGGSSTAPEVPAPIDQSPSKALSKRIVEYHIAVVLHPDSKTLEGTQTFSWTNPGSKPVNELYLHLYPNAFQSKNTTFMQESGGKLRNDKHQPGSFGRMDITRLTTSHGVDLLPRTAFVQPDDGNEHDQTLMKVLLTEPVAPGETITLTADFTVRLPAVFARMGYSGNFFMAGQWFPKVAKFEPAGTRGRTEDGWNLHQYHGNSEFYADFGIYNVKIKVPESFTVAATGFPVKSPAVSKGMKTYHFYADDVHDFAWAASPDFLYYEEGFSAPDIPGVKIKLYLDPAHESLKDRYFAAAKKTLARLGAWIGEYPYQTLSIVVPPPGGNGAGGMEYPTLITAWAADETNPGHELERVIVHEISHQYWYGMIASNEFEEAWLDEGFTSYAEDKIMELEYGVKPNLPIIGSYMTTPEALTLHSWQFAGSGSYADNVYYRAKLVLHAIEAEIGQPTMQKVLRNYFRTWKFRHPGTEDFQAILEKETKRDWSVFFDTFVYGGQMIDYAADHIRIRKVTSNGQPVYESQVLITRRGAYHPDVPIRFRFADGHTIDKHWHNSDESSEIVYTLTYTVPLEWVMVDPDYTLILENRHINNFLKSDIDTKTKTRTNLGLTKWIEALFGWVAW